MDDFIDPFLQSSPWHDMSASSRSYGGDESSPPICMIPSNMENSSAEAVDLYRHDDSSSFFTDATLSYCISKGLFPELNASCSVALPHNSFSVAGSIESSGTEPSGFTPSLGDPHSVTSVPAMWPSSYSDVCLLGQGEHQSFGSQVAGSDVEIPKKTPLVNGKFSCMDSLPGATLQDQNEIYNSCMANFSDGHQLNLPRYSQPRQQEINELHNFHVPFLAAGSQMISSKVAGIQARPQLSQPAQVNTMKHQTNDSFGNGSVKPRVRARRGQATDPHSIAERLRRVKIAERMKNLQELVPNSNKADKASMLDEIIDYVRFLQLQVKVLSMSRLGAAGAGAAVHPITDSQSELQDDLAFEQEVVKLMESSVTAAMQYLQNKGLCLMPIALASAVSTQKGCSDATIKREEDLKSIGN